MNRILIPVLTICMMAVFIGCGRSNGDNALVSSPQPTVTCTVKLVGTGTDEKSEKVAVGSEYTVPGLPDTFTTPEAGTLPADAVGNTAKYCAGWNTKNDGTGIWYKAGDTPAVTADTTLYAIWGYGFRVGQNKWVYFSKGNLYYDTTGTTPVYSFEEKQYEITPAYDDTTSGTGNWDTSHVSHFYWSKDAGVAYAKNYSDGSAETTDVLFTNGTQTTPNSSFTVNGVTGKYRALSKDEWVWLLGPSSSSPDSCTNCRETTTSGMASGARYAEVTVNDVKGMIIFPDRFAWTSSMGTAPSTVNTYCSSYDAGNYDTTQFAAMEAAGVVFLPAAGVRFGSEVHYVGSNGHFWSSSAHDIYVGDAYFLGFFDGYVGPASNFYDRDSGRTIRLVCGD